MYSYIPERFQQAVYLHLLKNTVFPNSCRVPLLLGIHGPSGEGKTYQCEACLKEIDAEFFLLSGGQLESENAGEPAQRLRRLYLEANRCLEQRKCNIAVILLNDIDTGVGNWGETVQYTVNRQTLFGELMHLVDYPTRVANREVRRIPIIITGNDFTKLYEPLVRAGRMTGFKWQPTTEEKIDIVHSGIFPNLPKKDCETLVKTLEKEALYIGQKYLPTSFFAHLKSTIIDRDLWSYLQKNGIQNVMLSVSPTQLISENNLVENNIKNLMEEGRRLVHSGNLINHLTKS